MSQQKLTGKCLCGSVQVSFLPKDDTFGTCHCKMCQTWSGGPGFAVEVGGDLTVSGEDSISTYTSSQWAERAFCKKCGTHLFYRLKAGGYMNFPLGFLENTNHLRFSTQIFIDKKPAHYSFAEDTAIMTEAEFLDTMK